MATSVGGETARAFIPDPLPPVPQLRLTGPMQKQMEQAPGVPLDDVVEVSSPC